jgi:glutathione S-transferase
MNELSYVTVDDAVAMPGLRVAFSRGVPGPWGVGARGILEYKGIPFTAVAQEIGEPNEPLMRWTGQTSAPVAVLDDERPRASWSEIILLAERLAPERPLIPKDQDDRATMFGVCHELCAEDGLGWSLRLMMFDARGRDPGSPMVRKYDSGVSFEHARDRANAILSMLARRLQAQKAAGSEYLVGAGLTAADFYWTGFSHLLRTFPPQVCDMPEFYTVLSDMVCPHLDPLPEILFEHRDRILRDHMRCPFKF